MKQISLSLLLFPIILLSQIKIHKTITTSDGLVNGQVLEIFEDSKGYIWFATAGGVSRWDGTNFKNYTELNGLISSNVFDIAESPDGRIYFANFGKSGINTLKDKKLDTLFAEGKNKLGFFTLLHFTKDTSLVMCTDDGIVLYKNNTLVKLNFLHEIKLAAMHEIAENSKGELFIATEDGILKLDGMNLEIIYGYDGTKNNYVSTLAINSHDEIFFTNERQFLTYKDDLIKEVDPALNYLGNKIEDMVFGYDNTCYMATKLGLGILRTDGSFELITNDNGLSNNHLFKIFLSKNGYLYTASAITDVNLYKPGLLEIYNTESGLIDNNIFNFFIDDSGKKYISTNEGLQILSGNENRVFTPKDNSKFSYFLSFAEIDGKIFMGTADGVDEFKDGKFVEIIKFDKGRHMRFQSTNSVFSLTAYNNEVVLAGTYRGVFKITGDKYEIITVKDGLLSDYVNFMLITKDNSIVYGYHNKGISIEKNGKFIHYTTDNGLSNNAITHICERSDGAIMVGTELGGLNIIKEGRIDTLTTDDGLSSNEIRAIAEDSLGNVYVSTPNGLNILSFEKEQINCRQITKLDGLSSNNCSQNSLFVDQENNVWIGTSNGLNKYNPIFDRPSTTAPSIYLTGFEIYNKPFSLENFLDNPKLKYNQNYLNFSYAGINTPNNHKIVYQYRLSGVDDGWVTSRSEYVQYTSLDDGQYTFEVKARNEWGYWSEPASLSFVISPAWWETWWFYTLAFIAIGSLIAFISSYRYRHLLIVEKMRTKISADLHDSVGSGLSEISILSELLGAQVAEEKKDFKSGLNNISTISRNLIESMSDIVWLVNPKKDTLKDLFKRLQLSYHEVLKYSDIDLLVENLDELEHVRLPMNFRQHLYLIFKEAINNAIKYSGGDLLNLKIETSGNTLKVTFTDNGKGFELNSEKMGNGLINMKNRAKEIGGDINYFSEINKGTTVIFEGKFKKHKSSFI